MFRRRRSARRRRRQPLELAGGPVAGLAGPPGGVAEHALGLLRVSRLEPQLSIRPEDDACGEEDHQHRRDGGCEPEADGDSRGAPARARGTAAQAERQRPQAGDQGERGAGPTAKRALGERARSPSGAELAADGGVAPESLDDSCMRLVRVGVGEGPVRRTIPDREREVLTSGRDRRPGVDVEQRRTSGSARTAARTAPAATPSSTMTARSRRTAGNRGTGAYGGTRRAAATSTARSSSKAKTPGGRSSAAASRGCTSPSAPARAPPGSVTAAAERGWSQVAGAGSNRAPETPRLPSTDSTAALAS
jgi:hypothetical protein